MVNVVVDTNILAYYWLPGARTEEAAALRRSTGHWYVPKLWRSEFRNVLAGLLRRKVLDPAAAKALVRAVEAELADFEREVDSIAVIDLVSGSDCSAYDCEFVALARSMGVPLVTEDRKVRCGFSDIAVGMAALIA